MSHPIYRALVTYSNTSTGEIRIKIPSLIGLDSEVSISYIGRAIKGTTWSVPDIGDQIVVTADDANLTNIFWLQVDETASNGVYGDAFVGSTNTFSTNQIIQGTTTAALLRITQLGTGNALLVEDSTNPDSTPFVVTADGNTIIGATSTSTTSTGVVPKLQLVGLNNDSSSSIIYNFANDSTTTVSTWAKSRGGSFGTQGAALNADAIGNLNFEASDGTQLRRAAQIIALVDATPSAGVVQGRIQFSTANLSGTMTERMRIDSAGQVGIGAVPTSGRNLTLSKILTGGSGSVFGILQNSVIQQDVTTAATYFRTGANTVAAAFTLPTLFHFHAVQNPFGASSVVTTQVGFLVDSSLNGASFNYGFMSDIASAGGRFNLYMVGTAANYMAGRLGVGATLTSGAMAQVVNTTAADDVFILKGAASQTGDFLDIQNSAGTSVFTVDNTGTTKTVYGILELGFARTTDGYSYIDLIGDTTYSDYGLRLLRGNTGANTISQLIHRGLGSLSITTQDAAPLLFSTTNTERMRISSTGTVGIGATTLTGTTLRLGRTITGNAFSQGLLIDGTIQPEVTSRSDTVWSNPSVAAAVTLPTINHFYASSPAIGAGSTVTTVAGFVAESNLGSDYSGTVTNAYGFIGNLASGTNRYNLFMGGTAANYLGGRLGVGVGASGAMVQVVNTTAADKVLVVKGAASQTGDFFDIQNSAGTSQLRIDSSGQVGIASPPTANIRLTVTGGSTNSANPVVMLNGVSGSGALYLHNDMGAGSYNSIVSAGSKGIIATGANSTTARASFVIAPWSDLTYGIRFEGGATTNILQHGTVILSPSAAANKALVVKGVASQTANLQEWQDSSGAILAHVTSAGAAKFTSIDGGTP